MGEAARPVRVLHVINQLRGHGGAEVSLAAILAGTEGSAFHHAVALLRRDGNQVEALERTGVAIFLPRRRLGPVTGIGHVRHAVSAFRPDVVHTTLFDAGVAGRIAARAAGVPVVTSIVNTPPPAGFEQRSGVPRWKRGVVRTIDRALDRACTTRFHAISETLAADLVERRGVAPDRVVVVPRGRAADELGRRTVDRRAAARRALALGETDIALLSVAREEHQKGQIDAVRALAELRRRDLDAALFIAGRRGSASDALDRAVAQLGLDGAVRRLGVRDDVPELLCAADVFVFPSLFEGLGGSLIEAMALQTPIVASDIAVLREVLDDGRCGLLVTPGDVRGLADAICEVVADQRDAARRVEAARRRFESEYELTACLDRMAQLWRSVAQ